jgi:hypothetical protein
MTPKTQKMTLDQFKTTRQTGEIEAVIKQLNGGSFMQCHQLIFEQTGIWIDDLVPVFQKLDALATFRELPAEVR